MADGNGTKPEDTANSFENSISKSKAEWLKPYHWPKGISGNPSGRPPKPITEAYADIAQQKYPGDPKGRTYAQLAAEGQFNAAIKGKTDAAREIADRLEGKAVQPVVGDDTASTSVTVNIEAVRKKLFGDDE
jgi:Family of unknown function (DUF5681)